MFRLWLSKARAGLFYFDMNTFGECHGHLFMDGVDYARAKARYLDGPDKKDIHSKLKQYRDAGITFYRDGGDRYGAGVYAKAAAREYGMDIRTPVFGIHRRGCYGGIVGYPFDTIREYRQLVARVKEEGGDFIKIMCSGLLDYERCCVTGEALEGSLIREMVSIAHAEGFAVMAHVDGKRAIYDTAAAGADSIEHGFFIDEDCMDVMKETGSVWVPTIATICNLIGCGRYPEPQIRKIAAGHEAALRMAWKKGIQVALGSDAGAYLVPHVKGILDEYTHVHRALEGMAGAEEIEQRLISGENVIKNTFKSGYHKKVLRPF